MEMAEVSLSTMVTKAIDVLMHLPRTETQFKKLGDLRRRIFRTKLRTKGKGEDDGIGCEPEGEF